MRNVYQAIAELGSAIGLDDAELDDAGNLTLIVDGAMSLNMARIDDESLEFWTRLPDLGSVSDAGLLAQLLVANHLGEGTGAARLALTPDRTAVILCERVSVSDLETEALTARLADFLRHATFWASQSARDAVGARRGGSAPAGESHGDFMIRA